MVDANKNLDEKEIEIHEKYLEAYNSTTESRNESADDYVFATVTQWDDFVSGFTETSYKGEFDLLNRPVKKIIGELQSNPIEAKFDVPDAEMSEILQGMYRTTMRTTSANEATDVAIEGACLCGMGAWRIGTKFQDEGFSTNENKIPEIQVIQEAHSTVYFDPNSKRRDKSDAKWGGVLTFYKPRAHKELLEENGIDPERWNISSFENPTSEMQTPFFSTSEGAWISEHYEIEEEIVNALIYEDFNGEKEIVKKSDSSKIEELLNRGFEKVSKKKVKEKTVFKYIVDGGGIISGPVKIAGKNVPIIPFYGEHRFVDGNEWWCGLYRRSKDTQRLHNMGMSFVADQISQTPQRKPIFSASQIQGHEWMYQQRDDIPYLVMNDVDASGNPVDRNFQYLEGPQITAGEAKFLEMTERAVDNQVFSQPFGAKALNGSVTEGQLALVDQDSTMQSFSYQQNYSVAMRRTAEVWLSIVKDLIVEDREVSITGLDDKVTSKRVNYLGFNKDGIVEIKNNLNEVQADVYTNVGKKYSSLKEEAQEKLGEILRIAGLESAYGESAALDYISLMDIPFESAIEKFVNEQKLIKGYRQPENEKDVEILENLKRSEENKQNDPSMLIAQAENNKSKADLITAQTKRESSYSKIEKEKAESMRTKAQTAQIMSEIKSKSQPEIYDKMLKVLEIKSKELEIAQKNKDLFS